MTDGTGQRDRLPFALEDRYFLVDELSVEQLLALSVEHARHVRFYDEQRRPAGTWAPLLESNDTAVMARIASVDTEALLRRFDHALERGPTHAIAEIHALARAVDTGLRLLRSIDTRAARELRERVEIVVRERLGPRLRELDALVDELGDLASGPAPAAPADRDPAWRASVRGGAPPRAGESGWLGQEYRADLRAIFFSFASAIRHVQDIVPAYLEESLEGRTHDPAAGLFIAFLHLFASAQKRLNTFTDRHVDFYYERVLGAAPRAPTAARALLALEPTGLVRRQLVPAGTRFLGTPREGGAPVVFAADGATTLQAARVVDLRTLRLERDPRISPENVGGFVTRAKVGRIAATEPVEDVSSPLFGGAGHADAARLSADAPIGFAVVSRTLALAEGTRSIAVVLHLERHAEGEAPGETLREVLQALFEQHVADRAPEATSTQVAPEELPWLVETLLGGAFDVALTTPDGWHAVARYAVTAEEDPGNPRAGSLRFDVTLAPEAPPVTGYDPALHGGRWEARAPAIRFRLGAQASFCAYSIFDNLVVRRVVLETAVRGLRGLRVYNQLGPVDPSGPFQPFGPQPGPSAYLVVGAYEAACKTLERLEIALQWGDLPVVPGGFSAHYAAYDAPPAETDFRVEPLALRDGAWSSEIEAQPASAPLFRLDETTLETGGDVRIDTQVGGRLRPLHPSVTAEEFDLALGVRTGFVKLALKAPPDVFGHASYPLLLARSLSRGLRLGSARPAPRPPYTPLVTGITADYDATAQIVPAEHADRVLEECLVHLHPFGHAAAQRDARSRATPALVPRYPVDGALFIGVEGDVGGSSLSLLFHLDPETRSRTAIEGVGPVWSYLSHRGWRVLEPYRVVADSTSGLMRSGVVVLDLPDDLDRDGSVMPPGPAWLMVGVEDHADAYPRLFAVVTNGLTVSRADGGPTREGDRLATRGEWRAEVTVPGVGAVRQVGEPFGEARREERRPFRTRMSERLRHKGRATTPWDYERLILEHFPDVSKVKCFPATRSDDPAPAPGHVLVAVLPHAAQDACARSMVNALRMREIEQFAESLSSRFVQVSVRNASYDRIQVRCCVRFVAAGDRAYHARRLNDELVDLLSPWVEGGYAARFGWSLRCDDLHAFIRGREYVASVDALSVLRVATADGRRYTLDDTARASEATHATLRGSYPWSIALPMRRHHIDPYGIRDTVAPPEREPRAVGVADLEVGNTFIVGRGQRALDPAPPAEA